MYFILGIIGLILVIFIIIWLISVIIGLFSKAATTTLTPLPTPIITPTPTSTLNPSPTPISFITPTPFPVGGGPPVFQRLSGPGFTLNYPINWGLVTCTNSPNFEFVPNAGFYQTQIFCSVAQQPITVIVSNNLSGCSGERVMIGNVQVLRSTITQADRTVHQWCTLTNPVLKITNRISTSAAPASSSIDYSVEIEVMIASLHTTLTSL